MLAWGIAMTTYAYSVTLDDTEFEAVYKALKDYASFCEVKLSERQRSPYGRHQAAIEAVLERLFADMQMTSTNSFCLPKKFKQ